MSRIIPIPYNFNPRPYQLPFLDAMDSGKKRAIKVWHRKAGKEKVDWNFMIKKTQERVGNYWYIFPKLTQSRKALWEFIDGDGFRYLDHIPKEALDGDNNNTSMFIRLKCKSTIQLVGGDNFDASSIGGNPIGVVFSEYSLTSPMLWAYVRPILAQNGGWAVFNLTPRGENHAHALYCLAKEDPENWFSEILTVNDTHAIPLEVLEQEHREIVKLHGNDSLYRQEYLCDFNVPIVGAYYAAQIMRAYESNRVGRVPYEPRLPVSTYWDLGVDDTTVIWFAQMVGGEIRLIDYVEDREKGLPHYAKILKEKPYVYGTHVAPHDIEVTELGTGITRRETAGQLGIEFMVAPKLPLADGIDATRSVLERCWFDSEKCKDGINAIKNYRKTWDDNKKCYLDQPYHDWSSNASDALRTMAVSLDLNIGRVKNKVWMHPATVQSISKARRENPYKGVALPEAEWRRLQGVGR